MSPARRQTLLWLAQRLAGLLLAGGLAVHLVAVGRGGGAALLVRLAASPGWQLFYAALVGLALVHGGLGVRGLWRERRHGLGALSVQRLTGVALVLFVPVHVAAMLAGAAPMLAALPLHRGLEAALVALVVGHGLGGVWVMALEGLLWPMEKSR